MTILLLLLSLAAGQDNALTEEEKSGGWKLLFDGTSTDGWRGYKMDKMPPGWKAENGVLARVAGGAGGKGAGGGDDIVTEVSMAKWWTTDLQKRLTSECVQLHGGYGFMLETPIAEDYADAAVQSIYAGTNEIMKVIISRRLGLG